HPVEYQFDWMGNGSDLSPWGPSTQASAWDLRGPYQVRARARCALHHDVVSAWSSPLPIDIGGPTIANLLIDGGAANTDKTPVAITYTASPSATQVRTSTGSVWGNWLNLPLVPHNVSLGTVNGIVYVYAQVKDADGRISAVTFATIKQDTKLPSGVVKINGGNTTALRGGARTTVRGHQAHVHTPPTGTAMRGKTR